MAKLAIRIVMASAVLGLWSRRRGGLEFGREPREFTGEEFVALFSSGMAATIAFAAIVTDPLLEVQVNEDGDWRDITPGEIDQLHIFLEAESAKVDPTDPPTGDAADAQSDSAPQDDPAAAAEDKKPEGAKKPRVAQPKG